MTQTEALNIAIDYMNERLEEHDAKYQRHPATEDERNNILADIETIKAALAQPAVSETHKQEPVAWRVSYPDEPELGFWFAEGIGGEGCLNEPLYTTPPPVTESHKRKPLTDEVAMFAAQHKFLEWNRQQNDRLVKVAYEYGVFQKAIELYNEAAHGIKEKNTSKGGCV